MDNNFIEIRLDTDGVISDAENIADVLENAGEDASKAFSEGVNEGLVIDYDNIIRQLQELVPQLTEIEDKMKAIEDANADGVGIEYYQELEGELSKLYSTYGILGQKAEELAAVLGVGFDVDNLQTIGEEAEEDTEAIEELGEAIDEGLGDEANRKVLNLGKSLKNIGKSAKSSIAALGKAALTLTALAFGARSARALIGKFTAAYKEGLGNLIKYSGSTKKMLSELDGSLTSVKNALAAAFAPVLTAILPILTLFINKIIDVINAIGMMVAKLTGQSSFTAAKKGIDGTTKALDGAAGAAKNANKQLASFDKLNNTTTNDGGGGGGTDPKDMFEDVDIEPTNFEKLQEILSKIKPLIDEIGKAFLDGFLKGIESAPAKIADILASFQTIKDALKEIFTDEGLTEAVHNMIIAISGAIGAIAGAFVSVGLTCGQLLVGSIAEYLTKNSGFITRSLTTIANNVGAIATRLGSFATAFAKVFDAFGEEDAKRLGGAIIGVFATTYLQAAVYMSNIASDVTKLLTQPFIDNSDKIKKALEGLLKPLADVAEHVQQKLTGSFEAFNKMYEEHVRPLFDSLTKGISDLGSQVLDFWNADVQPVIDSMAKDITDLWDNYVQPVINDGIELVGLFADEIKILWENVIRPFMSWFIANVAPVVLEALQTLWTSVKTSFSAIMTIVDGVINHIKLGITAFIALVSGDWDKFWKTLGDIVKNVLNTVEKVINIYFNGFKQIFSGLWATLKPAINAILSGVEMMANGIITAINTIIEAFNALSIDIPSWVPEVGGNSLSINIPKIPNVTIPRLATGAVIPANKEFLAVLGDQKKGTNIEAPLDTIKEAVAEVIGSRNDNAPIIISIDGREVFRAVRDQDYKFKRSTGKSAFSY